MFLRKVQPRQIQAGGFVINEEKLFLLEPSLEAAKKGVLSSVLQFFYENFFSSTDQNVSI